MPELLTKQPEVESTQRELTPAEVFMVELRERYLAKGLNPDSLNVSEEQLAIYDEMKARQEAEAMVVELEDELRDKAADFEAEVKESRWVKIKNGLGSAAVWMQVKMQGAMARLGERMEERRERDEKKIVKRRLGQIAVGATLVGTGLALQATGNQHLIDNAADFIHQNYDKVTDYAQSFNYNTGDISQMVLDKPTTDIFVGGMTDGGSEHIQNAIGNDGTADKTIAIKHPGQAAPFYGAETFGNSVDAGADETYNAIKNELASGNTVNVKAYSQGTVIVQEALERIKAENNGVLPEGVNVFNFASPDTPVSGIYNSNLFKAVAPALEAFDVTTTHNPMAPGSKTAAYKTDLFANGNRPLTTVISNAIGYFGDGHAMPTIDEINDPSRTVVTNVDGVTVNSVAHEGTQNAALRVAEKHGFNVTEAADKFASALAPTGEVGQASPQIDVNDVVHKGAIFADETAAFNGNPNTNFAKSIEGMDFSHLNPVVNEALSPEAAAPIAEAVNNVAEVAAPVVEAAQPVAEAAAPIVNTPVEVPAPVAEAVQPVIDTINQHIPTPVETFQIPAAPVQAPAAPAPVQLPAVEIPAAPALPPMPAEAQQVVDQANALLNNFR